MADMYETTAWGKKSAEAKFEKMTIKRNLPGPEDVTFEVVYCGICHSDIHLAHNDMGNTKYPIVPGHELAGVVTAVGSSVTRFKVGDKCGVGCIVDSCGSCGNCQLGEEQYCDSHYTLTFNMDTAHGRIKTDSGYTYGGYSASQTVNQKFLIKVPDEYPIESAGPIFCAAITMYSPLVHWKAIKGGMNIGVVGIGGLGQFGIRLAKAMGNKVYAISTSPNKEAEAKKIGADGFIVSKDADSMSAAANSLDLILNTVSANHELSLYLPLLRKDGTLVQLGLVAGNHSVNQFPFIVKRISVAGCQIGGIKETQDCMDFCTKHAIYPATKVVTADQLDEVYHTLENKNDQIIRYVLDVKGSL